MYMRHTAFGETQRSLLDRLIAWVRLRRILPYIPPNTSVLDLGCGYHGDLLQSLTPRIRRGVGIDLSVAPSPNLIAGRVDTKISLPSNSFEVITALAIIEHVQDPETMLRECYRLLKPGGKLLITTPSLYGKPVLEFMAFLHLISKVEIDDHKRYYTQTSLRQALIKAGFSKPHVTVQPFGLGYLNLFGAAVK